ncbi:two-component system sensor histidine kinase RppB [Gloeocapsopsis sp. IPPAS B-1203]|uniref:two-component system sensor histidine kinase RppB n=1 Tax=Gloeocapsopsis sp. IPPAS B-1203 TaxID=2049454 RepID=UPI000C17AA0F|nr:two-component system sensor histidine kinase RppB [Gloeocapsopsis sp. IPPAS B-1203]PIG91624.1 two-component sensor histidine kinase [Gloeocapsopsis sp. IPPAS B-1203]
MNSHQLFRRSRTRLALWYALVMGIILSLSWFGMYRALVQANWAALEREIESIAGTLHDSLEPRLSASEDPAVVLQRIFPELCLVGQFCNISSTLIQRHTIGISDRSTYYIRLFDHHGKLLAFSPNQPPPLPQTFNPAPWQTFRTTDRTRYLQFTTILHSANAKHQAAQTTNYPSWGYLQIGRTLAPFDAETRRMQWTFIIGFPIALGLVVISSWRLSGLAMQPIYQSYQQQQQFTANAAHELRSPLASLLATIEAILRVPQSNQQNIQIMLHTVERQGRRLSHLIADLLFLTSLEQDSSLKPFQPCCLNDLINDLTEEFLELATASDIHLTSRIPDFEVYILGNESQLYRLVSNLIANAIQYTPSGGQVSASLTVRDRTAIIAVKDTGIGIPLAEQTQIFDRFYRVDGDRSRKTGGTGLGLAIALAIAQKHQAHLSVESLVGQGSIFTLEMVITNHRTFRHD